jgi:hypothetical protein
LGQIDASSPENLAMSSKESNVTRPSDFVTPAGVPELPRGFSGAGACEDRRRLIRKIVVGVPAIVAMTARSSRAGGGQDHTAPSAPSNPSNC